MFYLDESDDAPHLSFRERQVLEQVAQGRSAKEVAAELGINHRTVERHIENARYKMRARNKTHMIAKAMICGEIVFSEESPDKSGRRARGSAVFSDGQILEQ